MSPQAQDQVARCQSLANDNPGYTQVRVAYLVGIPLTRLSKWCERKIVVWPAEKPKPAPQAKPEPVTIPPGAGGCGLSPEQTAIVNAPDEQWSIGPIPTIESIRNEIKRRMRDFITDSLTVSQYASALVKLQDLKVDESAEADRGQSGIIIHAPEECRRPPDEPDEPEE